MSAGKPEVFIVDDNESIRRSMGLLLASISQPYRGFSNAYEFLDFYDGSQRGCLVLDIRLPGMNGLQLQRALSERDVSLPIIFITGHGDVPMAVEAIRNGAIDFLIKPFREQDLLDAIHLALEKESAALDHKRLQALTRRRIASLTPRQLEVFDRVTRGEGNKAIAAALGISERTVEVHRSAVMRKMKTQTLAELIKLKLAAE